MKTLQKSVSQSRLPWRNRSISSLHAVCALKLFTAPLSRHAQTECFRMPTAPSRRFFLDCLIVKCSCYPPRVARRALQGNYLYCRSRSIRVREVLDCEDPSEKTRAVRSVFTGLIERTIKYFKKKASGINQRPFVLLRCQKQVSNSRRST